MLNLFLIAAYGAAAIAIALIAPGGLAPGSAWLAGLCFFLLGGLCHLAYVFRRSERLTTRRLVALKKAFDMTRADLLATREEVDHLRSVMTGQAVPLSPLPLAENQGGRDTGRADPDDEYLPAPRIARDLDDDDDGDDDGNYPVPARPPLANAPGEDHPTTAGDLADVEAEVRVLHGLLEKLYADGTDGSGRVVRGIPHAAGDGDGAARAAALADIAPAEVDERRLILDIVRESLRQDRVDLYLQPIVSLPQRKRRFYECYSRIRDAEGNVLTPDRYMPVARDAGLVTAIDNMLLFRCLQLLRKLQKRETSAVFFCNISAPTLADRDFLHDFVAYMESHAELAPNLVLEIAHRDMEANLAVIEPCLHQLGRLGYRFSVDGMADFAVDIDGLIARHVHFVKIDAADILRRSEQGGGAEVRLLKQQLDQKGVDLIVERIESERMLVELLDYNIDFGQGYLFGEPRLSKDPAEADREPPPDTA